MTTKNNACENAAQYYKGLVTETVSLNNKQNKHRISNRRKKSQPLKGNPEHSIQIEGPFVCSLDDALLSFNVQRQAYYSGTLFANHINRPLKVLCISTATYTIIMYFHRLLLFVQHHVNLLQRSVRHLYPRQ